jgi:hypothetical protein
LRRFIASRLFVCEGEDVLAIGSYKEKLWLWIASFGESYNGDVLQLAKQLFSLSLQQMTKYCIMRECENIHSWISLVGDLAFSHQGGIYGFPQNVFWGSLPQISLFYSFPKLKHPKSSTFGIDALSFCIRMAQCHPISQAFSQVPPSCNQDRFR